MFPSRSSPLLILVVSTTTPASALVPTMPCDWSDNEEITNDDGNNFDRVVTTTVATDDGTPAGNAGNMETSETWYAWMGD